MHLFDCTSCSNHLYFTCLCVFIRLPVKASCNMNLTYKVAVVPLLFNIGQTEYILHYAHCKELLSSVRGT